MVKQKIWTIEKIKMGFEKFFKEYSRYPTVLEIDSYKHLPSSRQLQRRWQGGVCQLRKELGLKITNFANGEQRSKIATFINKRGTDKERQIQKILIEYFGEICVHEQKPFNNYSGRFDFLVYAQDKKFAIDVFYPIDKFSFIGCLNSKQHLYKNIDFDIILLQMNEDISQEYINEFSKNKKNQLLKNFKVLCVKNFLEYIKTIKPFILLNKQ